MIIFIKQARVLILMILSMYFGLRIAEGQVSRNFIYAHVTTKDNLSFDGFVKFGKRTFLWTDFFTLDKLNNPYADYLPIGEDNLTSHQFSVRFGFIKAIDFRDDKYVSVEIKEKKFINLKMPYQLSDLDIEINDASIGIIKLNASSISRMEFQSPVKEIPSIKKKPLYGTVLTSYGEFTGFICWDKDEVYDEDLLDGQWEDKEASIYFKNIKSIEKYSECSFVTTISGVRIMLCDSNDVNLENRGIIVNMPNVGKLNIPWREFVSLELSNSIEKVGLSYDDFVPAQRLSGLVSLKNGAKYSGVIVFDIDEAMNVENLDGYNSGLEFTIPFMNVKSLSPKGDKYSKVVLRNGVNLLLGSTSDVNSKNAGLLIFDNSGTYDYISWKDIDNIVFE